MSFRYLFPLGALVCVYAFATTMLAQPRENEEHASELRRLRHSYRDAMVKIVDITQQRYMQGLDRIDGLLEAQVALANADATIAATPAERVAAFESSVESLKELEANLEERVEVGAGRSDELIKCTAARIYAEILVLEERERQDSGN